MINLRRMGVALGAVALIVVGALGTRALLSDEPTSGQPVVPAETETSNRSGERPAIEVEDPSNGAEISSPVLVAGTADVFEANVSIRILDENGRVLTKTFTTATCGTGCRGDFAKKVAFEVTERQVGRIEVLTYSAEDGSPQDVVTILVTLVP